MILLKFLLIIFSIFVYLIKVLEFTYRFQIKEYRWDRMKSYIHEHGWKKILYSFDVILPAKKARNLFIITVLFIGAIFYSVFIYRFNPYAILVITILTPAFALVDVLALVWLTSIPVWFYREYKISQAAKKIAASNAVFIAVSGSYGKTSVKEYLYELLKTKYNVAKTDMNMNTDIGVALSVLKNLKKNTDYFIAEVGAYRTGEIAKICRYIRPTIVILTAFGNQHLDLYGSKAALVAAESEPIEYMRMGGSVYISSDIPEFEEITKGAQYQVRTISTRHAADYRAKEVQASHTGVSAVIRTPIDEFTIKSPLLGEHVITNLLPAIACAMDLGVSKAKIRVAIQELKQFPNKLSVHTTRRGAKIISDGANSNVEGFIEAIKVTSLFPQQDKYIASKGIIELGVEKEASYKKILAELLKTDIILLTTDPLFAELSKKQVILFENEIYLKDHLQQYLHQNNVLLIEGRFTPLFMKSVLH